MHNLKNILIPCPKQIEQQNVDFKISEFGGCVHISSQSEGDMLTEGKKLIEDKLFDMAVVKNAAQIDAYKITITIDSANKAFSEIESDEAYTVEVGEKEAVLCAKGEAGAFYACVTFADMIYTSGDYVMIPGAYIKDYPDFRWRGNYFECRYGSELMTLQDWYDAIDYIAKQKCNIMGINLYGCWGKQYDERRCEYLYVPLTNYPELKTEKNIKYYSVQNKKWVCTDNLIPPIYEEDFFTEIIKYAKKKNITVFPSFNSLGHNTLLPRSFPEIAAKDEEGKSKNSGFCTKNDKTFEILFSIYDNIIDKYLLPNGLDQISVGLDEVGSRCECADCKGSSHAELMIAYIIKICKYLKSKGMKRIYMCHDMLYNEFGVVNEELKQRFVEAGIYDELVLQWWTYEDPQHLFWGKADGVNNILHSIIKPYTGYYSWCIPTEHCENIRACTALAKERGFEGVFAYGSYDLCYDKNFLTLSEVTWNTDTIGDEEAFNRKYALITYPDSPHTALNALHSIGDIMKDDSRTNYMNRILRYFEYYFYCYCNSKEPIHKNYPGEAFKILDEKKDALVPYLEFVKQKASDALSFFEGNQGRTKIHDNWLLTSRQYYVDADEFLTIYNMWNLYNDGAIDALKVVCELERLIAQRENLMSYAEKVKFKPSSYMYLRNMTVVRQFLIDLCNYFKAEIKKGNKPKLDIMDLSYVNGKIFKFLR